MKIAKKREARKESIVFQLPEYADRKDEVRDVYIDFRIRLRQIKALIDEMVQSLADCGIERLKEAAPNKFLIPYIDNPSLTYVNALQSLIKTIKGHCDFTNRFKASLKLPKEAT
jgi:hypothetical protein